MDKLDIEIVDNTNDPDYQCFTAIARTSGTLLGILQYKTGYGDTAEAALSDLAKALQISGGL